MITKRKPHVLQLVLALALAAHAAADILRFGDGALPSCAYDCQPLYAAQYECANGDAACFCARVGEEICADVCAGESRRVAAWVAGECAATSPSPTPTTSSASTTPISTTKASKTTTATAPQKPSSSNDAEEKKADPVEEGEKKDAAVKDPTVAHATAWYPTPSLNRFAKLTRMQVEKTLALLPDGITPDRNPVAAACVLCSLPQICPATNHSEPSALVGDHCAAGVSPDAAAGYGGV